MKYVATDLFCSAFFDWMHHETVTIHKQYDVVIDSAF